MVKATDGAVGYVDFSDAVAGELTYASIKNSTGKYIRPTHGIGVGRAQGMTVNPDLTFDPINAAGAKAYPITSPTWIMVYTNQTDPKKGAALKAFLTFVLGTGATEGQNLAKTVDYAPLPGSSWPRPRRSSSKSSFPRRDRQVPFDPGRALVECPSRTFVS